MTERELDKLLQKCTVRLSVSGGHGTGFFVAPSLILTCAHVVGNSELSKVNAFWRETNQTYTTKIVKVLSDPNIDLALLQLINEIPDHPCIYFDQSNPQLDDRLYSFGYPQDNPDGDSTTCGYEGESFRADFSLHKLKGGQFNYGSSGSPLLNRRTGGVCGIVAISRNTNTDLGGRAVSTSTIYDHLSELIDLQQQFHRRDVTWIKLLSLQQRQELIWKKSGRKLKNAPEGKWKNCTPNTELIRPLAIDPNKPEYIYVGTSNGGYKSPANGVYRSTDSGQTWKPINNGLTSLNIYSLLVSAHDGKIYAGTSDGLFVSTTQGDAWERDEYFRGEYVICIALSPHDKNLIFCGTARGGGVSVSAVTVVVSTALEKKYKSASAGGLHFSPDRASSWSTIGITTVNGIAVSPQDKDIIYFGGGTDDGLWKTSNNLITLEKVNNFVARGILCVAVSPQDDECVLVGTTNGLYISFDAGESWRNISEIGNIQVSSISFSPVNGNRIFAATINGIFESQDDGQSWQESNKGLYKWTIAVDISSNETAYVGTSGGGVYKRKINQKKWQPCNFGFSRKFAVYSLVVRKNLIYAGTHLGVFRSHDKGKSWLQVSYCGSVWSLTMPLVQPPIHQKKVGGLSMSTNAGETWQDTFITGNAPIYAGTNCGRIYKSEDAGFSWQLVGDLGGHEVYSLEISPHTTNIYAGIQGAGVFKSTDRGSSWMPINEGLNDLQIECLTVSVEYKKEILYCGTAKGLLYKSINGGESWQACGDYLPSQPIYSIAQSPTAIDLIYAATQDGLYKSCDGGLSWKFLDNNLGKQIVLSVLLSPLDSNLLYAGTNNGVFKSIDGGESWFFLGNEIDKKHFSDTNEVMRLVCSPENPSLIYAASQKGLFELADS